MPFMTLGTEIMIKSNQLTAVLCLLCSSITMAGTIIDIQIKNQLTTVLTDGKQSRVNMGDGEFVLVDHKSQQLMMVDPHKHEIILFDAKQISLNNGINIRTAVKRIGAGVSIAGYQTDKYEYFANGQFCGVIHGSQTAYQVPGVKALFSAMKMLMDHQQTILGGLANMLDACTLADMKLSDHVASIGLPMRSENNGDVETEIKNIQVGVNVPNDIFAIPASYRILTMPGQTNGVTTQMPKTQQYQPPMQGTMRRMQPSGQAVPQATQQMRHDQEMMRLYLQHR